MPIMYSDVTLVIDRNLREESDPNQRLFNFVGNLLATKIRGQVINQLVDGNDIALSRAQLDQAYNETRNDFRGTDIIVHTHCRALDIFFDALILEYYHGQT